MEFKREILKRLIMEKRIKNYSILGRATKELREVYYLNGNLIKLLEKYDINVPKDKLGKPTIYFQFFEFPQKKRYSTVCYLIVREEALNEEIIDKILDNLFEEIIDIYQCSTFLIMDKLINNIFTFEEMLMLIDDTQQEIAENIGKSRQLISEMKNGKRKMSIETLALLKREYPLLPWDCFINSYLVSEER